MAENYGKYITGLHGDPWPTVNYGGTIRLWFRVWKDRGTDPHPVTDNINGALGDGSLLYIHGRAGRDEGLIDHALLVSNASGPSLTCYTVNGTNSTLFDNTDPDFELWYHDLDTSAVWWVPRINEKQVTPGPASSNISGWGTTRYPFDRGVWDVCYNGNGKHYDEEIHQNTDKTWYGTEIYNAENGYQVRIEIIPGYPTLSFSEGRLDTHRRTAGEKAIYDDEFLVKAQIEAGRGVELKYRHQDGTLQGYDANPYKRMNIVIESQGLINVGVDVVSGISLPDGYAATWALPADVEQVDVLRFSDESDWQLDNALVLTGMSAAAAWDSHSIPIKFRLTESPDGTTHLSARTAHTGFYASENGNLLNAGPDGTIAHLEFEDSATWAWDVTELVLASHRGFRHGLKIKGTVTSPYRWFANDGTANYDVTNNDTVRLTGINGVAVDLTEVTPGVLFQFEIDRPFQLTNRDQAGTDNDVGNPDTVQLIADNQGVDPATTAVQGRAEFYDDANGVRRMKIFTPNYSIVPVQHKEMEWLAPNWVVENNIDMETAGELAHMNIGPYGLYSQQKLANTTAPNWYGNVIMDHFSTFEQEHVFPLLPPQDPVNGYDPKNLGCARMMEILTSGVYHINTKLQGTHQYHQEKCVQRIGHMRYRLQWYLKLYKEGNPIMQSHRLDEWHWRNGLGNYEQAIGGAYLDEDSGTWFLDGHIRVYIPAGWSVFSYLRVTHPNIDHNYNWYSIVPKYHNFEIELLTNDVPDTENDYPLFVPLMRF